MQNNLIVQLYLLILVQSPGPGLQALTGWDVCPNLLAPLALDVLLDSTKVYQVPGLI